MNISFVLCSILFCKSFRFSEKSLIVIRLNFFAKSSLSEKNEDGNFEVILIDTNNNGNADEAEIDEDEDGKVDVIAYDYNEDGEWDKFENV